ncbi:D-threo-aldose 1-dehydrogenase [Microlunatus sagamiharensis]|uniref:D-threo-aldose 1-dehydrogenase n=1 Tax=Microlunatus sagamiharensis TaxID=546874 RepID=A0A1H2MGS3_9ACTN|nr:aldo/keto reductase [Microlunatus sagamiharensis]SDU92420.1 D-threo-aldose 1-dehydrogenase [Microlunatus sagamiharensis]
MPSSDEPAVHARLPRLGLGTVAIGGLYAPVVADDAQALLDHALRRGIRHVDTAPMYGLTTAERRIGAFLDRSGRRDELVLSTKVGRVLQPRRLHGGPGAGRDFGWHNGGPFVERWDYSYDGVLRSVEDSVQRMGVDRLDVVHIHDIGVATHGDDNAAHVAALRSGGYRALDELRSAGVVGRIGVGANDTAAIEAVLEDVDLDCALLAGRFTLLEQPSDDSFFRLCADRGVALVAGGVYASGALTGAGRYAYTEAPQEVLDRVARLRDVCARHAVELPAAAVQLVAANPGFTSLLLGPRDPAELDQNLAWLATPVPTDLWSELVAEDLLPQQWAPGPGRTTVIPPEPAP